MYTVVTHVSVSEMGIKVGVRHFFQIYNFFQWHLNTPRSGGCCVAYETCVVHDWVTERVPMPCLHIAWKSRHAEAQKERKKDRKWCLMQELTTQRHFQRFPRFSTDDKISTHRRFQVLKNKKETIVTLWFSSASLCYTSTRLVVRSILRRSCFSAACSQPNSRKFVHLLTLQAHTKSDHLFSRCTISFARVQRTEHGRAMCKWPTTNSLTSSTRFLPS